MRRLALWCFNAGLVKNATALLSGLPVVTNSLGARGCEAPEPGCSVREDPASLADAAVELLSSREAAGRAGEVARAWAIEHFGADKVGELQLERLSQLIAKAR